MLRDRMLDDAIGVLLADDLADAIDLVLCRRDDTVEAHARRGSVGFTREGISWVRGDDPIADGDLGAFTPLDAERAAVRPAAGEHHYPYAYDNAAGLFEDPRAPDIAIVHTAAHNWEERGGHRGEHGSLNIVQSRAPLILAGAGIAALGFGDRHARMIDIAPTIGALMGLAPMQGVPGRILTEALDPAASPARVVAFLVDGTNANVLYAMAAAGELPAFARLMSMGVTFGHGLISSFPSVTLANHTTALTGLHPGGHRVLSNNYFDRATGRRIVTNAPEVWHTAREEVSPAAVTLFERCATASRGFTAAVNEPVDRGAASSTFDLVRSGAVNLADAVPPQAADVPGVTTRFAADKREYAFAAAADHMAVEQVRRLWAREQGDPIPSMAWVNLILPDAANHAGGPYSDIGFAGMRETDARLGAILDAMDWGGDDTAFVVLADHGMEESDPGCKGDFDAALDRAGIPFRDEGQGFIYLDPNRPRWS